MLLSLIHIWMLRLILDLGIEAHRLHCGHHTGQPHHIRVIGVADGLEPVSYTHLDVYKRQCGRVAMYCIYPLSESIL